MQLPPSREGLPDEPPAEPYHRGRKRVSAVVSGVIAVGAAAWLVLRWKPSRVRIEGASMLPSLFPDDWVLVASRASYRRGDVVVVEHPGRPGYEMVKRIVGQPGDAVGDRVLGRDEWWIEGDRPDASTDSRHFGAVSTPELKAKVVLIYWPRERRRLLRRAVATMPSPSEGGGEG
jgi:nickel-type superoxide dismutase maturation protease